MAQIPPDQLRQWDYVAGEKFSPEYWMPHGEICRCHGTGWVCQQCGGSQWYKARNDKGHLDTAVCPACSEVDQAGAEMGLVKHKSEWWEFVRQYGGGQAQAAPRVDRQAEYADRRERQNEREAELARRDDEMASEEVYADAA